MPQVAAVLGTEDRSPMEGLDPSGASVLTASAPVRQLDWHVFVEQPRSVALRPVYSLVFRTAWLLLLGIGLAVLATLLLPETKGTELDAVMSDSAR